MKRLPLRAVGITCRTEHDQDVGIRIFGDERAGAPSHVGQHPRGEIEEDLLSAPVGSEGIRLLPVLRERNEPVADEKEPEEQSREQPLGALHVSDSRKLFW